MKKLLALLGLSLALGGCNMFQSTPQKTPTKTSVNSNGYSKQELEDLSYVRSLSDHNENFIYDHSDDRQHRYFLAHLKRQGFAKETSPALYGSVAKLRAHHQHLRSKGMLRSDVGHRSPATAMAMVTGTGLLAQTTGTETPIPIQAISALGVIDGGKATATALSSLPGTVYYTQNTVQLLNGAEPLGAAVTSEKYKHGEDLKSTSTADYSSAGEDVLSAKMTYYYKLAETSQAVTGQFISNCKFCGPGSPRSCPSFGDVQPIGPAGTKSPIKVCINRFTKDDCTYFRRDPSTSDIVFPVSGSIQFLGESIKVKSGTSKAAGAHADLYIVNSSSGGGCKMIGSTDFFNHANTVVTGGKNSTLKWNIDPADFGAPCFTNGENLTFVLNIKLLNVDNVQMCAYVSNSTMADTAALITFEIGPMNVFYGCLAEGSMVSMEDGSQKPIEQVLVGDRVQSEDRAWTVSSTTRGTEPIPSVRIQLEDGRELLLTQEHPVPTANGVVVAKALVAGDMVLTDAGEQFIQSVSREAYDGSVWNLELGNMPGEEDLLTDDNSTFYANGILVGDHRMQGIHLDIHRNKKENVLSSLPAEWHTDYLNHLKNKK